MVADPVQRGQILVPLIHFDSHTGTLDKYFDRFYNHGTPFRRAVDENLLDVDHSIQLGLRGQQYQPKDRLKRFLQSYCPSR